MRKLAIVIGLGAAAWYWRKEIRSMVETQFPGVREKAARTLENAVQSGRERVEQAKSRIGNP
jgi:hypothetical protein